MVGPNGCGKSNVIDSIRWVLGESSPSGMRGDSMEDVIFNGTDNSSPRGRAMVELEFENHKKQLRGKYSKADRVKVKRVLERQSDSRYYINDTPCRRKDITDLFAGMGLAGKSNYAIVTQGSVTSILESKPENIRSIIEEAADITGYLQKRKETLGHIRKTKDNLRQINASLSEKRQQVRQLDKQVESARNYKEKQDRLGELKKQLGVATYSELRSKQQKKQASLEEVVESISKAKNNSALWETELQKTQLLYEDKQKEVAAEDTKLQDANQKVTELEAKHKYSRKNLEDRERDIQQTQSEIKRLKDTIQSNKKKLQQAQQELQNSKNKQQESKPGEEIAKTKQQLEAVEIGWQESVENTNKVRTLCQDQSHKINNYKEQLQLLDKQLTALRKKDATQQQTEQELLEMSTESKKLKEKMSAMVAENATISEADSLLVRECLKLMERLEKLAQKVGDGAVDPKFNLADTEKQHKKIGEQISVAERELGKLRQDLQQAEAKSKELEKQRRKLRNLMDNVVELRQKAMQDTQTQTEELMVSSVRWDEANNKMQQDVAQLEAREKKLLQETYDIRNSIKADDGELNKLTKAHKDLRDSMRQLNNQLAGLDNDRRTLNNKISKNEKDIGMWEERLQTNRGEQSELNLQLVELEKRLPDTVTKVYKETAKEPYSGMSQGEINVEIRTIERELNRIGDVNMLALEQFEVEQKNYEELLKQEQQITKALKELSRAIRRIDTQSSARFNDTFKKINTGFNAMFAKLTAGGKGRMELEDDPDNTRPGVRILASPPGKRNSVISSLSGGEKTIAAIAFIMSIFKLNPAPFCVLDEADAMLDDYNVSLFNGLLTDMALDEDLQFIVISHNKISMENAKHLIGITMSEPGVSQAVGVDVDKALELSEAIIKPTHPPSAQPLKPAF